MTALHIIAKIIDMGKDASYYDVRELIESRAMICDYQAIYDGIIDHASSNEKNAASYAVDIMEAR